MEYHAPTGRFTWSTDTPERVSLHLRGLIKQIREDNQLPLTPYRCDGPLGSAELLQARVGTIARELNIDRGGHFGHEIDLSDLADD